MAIRDDGLFTWSRTPVNNFKKGLQRYSKYNDPTYLGFTLLFDWYTPDENTAYGGSPLLSGWVNEQSQGSEPESWTTKPGTAMDYLRRCGEFQRMKYLNAFISTLKNINYYMPWYWQEMTGLSNAWQYKNFENPYLGGDEAKIEITCLESIDLKMTSIIDLYKKAVYDLEYRRIIIPENLRKFSVYVYVQEIRKFQIDQLFLQRITGGTVSVPGASGFSSPTDKINTFQESNPNFDPNNENNPANSFFSNKDTESLQYVNESSAQLSFNFTHCEFLPDESNEMISTLQMAGPEAAGQKIVFSYESFRESSSYPNVGTFLENQAGNVGSNATERWKEKVKSIGKNVTENALIDASEKLKGFANSLLLGNVHGFSAGSISTALEQGTIQGISQEIGQATSAVRSGSSSSLPGTDNVHNNR
jgi:hypothetical protein